MEKEQPNQTLPPVIETEIIEAPTTEKKEPVIETEAIELLPFVGFSNESKAEEIIPKLFPKDEGITRPETDRKLSHEKRILAFLEGRHTGDFIRLNDFLKSLYPLPKPNEKPAWIQQGAMRKLRQDLMAMRDRGEISFSNTNVERLGDNYHVGEQRVRKDYNIGDLIIEAKLA